jgi:hypothetical protein
MRLHIVSDLHTDITGNEWTPPPVACDVHVVVGDAMAPGTLALRKLREWWKYDRIVYALGNHDFYSHHDPRRPELKTTYEFQRANAPLVAAELGIDLIDDSACVIEIDHERPVRFLGGTLWTDFRTRPPYMSFSDAVRAAGRMNDYRAIKVGRGRSHDLFKPKDSIEAHKVTRRFIEAALAQRFDGDTVVCTHHSPYPTTPSRDLDFCYFSDLGQLMESEKIWIHGHVHSNQDYVVGGTRIISNPRGYPGDYKHSPRENPAFDPELVVETGMQPLPKMGM